MSARDPRELGRFEVVVPEVTGHAGRITNAANKARLVILERQQRKDLPTGVAEVVQLAV